MGRGSSPRANEEEDDDDAIDEGGRVRLDKWLWAARFFKTRRLSVEACEGGRVKLGDQALKPSRSVNVGERLRVVRDGLACEFVVLGLSARRGPASDAAKLYEETEESRAAREAEIARRKAAYASGAPKGRPTKRDRRSLIHYFAKGRSDS
ncbi:MAG: S4 domain-containing protein [Polyangiaceae bacterium]